MSLGTCDKKQYEHCGPHEQIREHDQKLPPFPCVNWKPAPVAEEKPRPTLNDRINALPDWARQYIHDIETKCDPAGDIRTITELRDTIRCLTAGETQVGAPQRCEDCLWDGCGTGCGCKCHKTPRAEVGAQPPADPKCTPEQPHGEYVQRYVCYKCGRVAAGAPTGEGAQNETDVHSDESDADAAGLHRGLDGGTSVVPSGELRAKSFHSAWGGPNGHGQVVKLEDALEYAGGAQPNLLQFEFPPEVEAMLQAKQKLYDGEACYLTVKIAMRGIALKMLEYAASSNATLQLAHAGVMQQLRSADKWIDDLKSKVSTLKGELGEERQAHEKIAEYLLPLVGTGDGTSVDAAKKAAGEIGRLTTRPAIGRPLAAAGGGVAKQTHTM